MLPVLIFFCKLNISNVWSKVLFYWTYRFKSVTFLGLMTFQISSGQKSLKLLSCKISGLGEKASPAIYIYIYMYDWYEKRLYIYETIRPYIPHVHLYNYIRTNSRVCLCFFPVPKNEDVILDLTTDWWENIWGFFPGRVEVRLVKVDSVHPMDLGESGKL